MMTENGCSERPHHPVPSNGFPRLDSRDHVSVEDPKRKKDGKTHDYWSVVENKRVAGGGRVLRRHVPVRSGRDQLLAGGRNWRKAIEVLRRRCGGFRGHWRCSPKIDVLRWRPTRRSFASFACRTCGCGRPRQWGACWLAGQLWRDLRLEQFWAERLPPNRKGDKRWDQVLHVLVSYRLIAPGSEWKLHRDWFGLRGAMADLLGADFRTGGGAQAVTLITTFCCSTKTRYSPHLTARWCDLF